MTLSTTTSRVSYPGTGSTGPFAYPFRILQAADLLVTKRSAVGVETVLTLTTHYTVAGALEASGTVTLVTALATGETLVIRRNPALTQPTSVRNQGTYFPSTHEDTFDRLAMQIQELSDLISRAPKLGETYEPATYNMAAVKPVANQVLSWDATGTKIESRGVGDSAAFLPGAGRTVATLTDYLANNAVFNVKDYGAKGDGSADDAAPINATIAACKAAGGGIVFFPVGTYKTTANITAAITDPPMGMALLGVFGATIIKPTAAVTIGFNIGSSSTDPTILSRFVMQGFRVDCTAMGAGAVGIKVGDNGITGSVPYSTYLTFRDVEVYNATGAGAKAWWFADVVCAEVTNCYGGKSTTNLHIEAVNGSMPTELSFRNSHFRSSPTGDGVVVVTGDGIKFDGRCVFEANALAGLRCAPTAGQNVSGLELDGVRCEGNYAGDTTKWQVHIDGTLAGTVACSLRNVRFNGAAKSIYYKNVRNCSIINPYPSNVVDAVFIDVGVQGKMHDWPHNNLAFATRYTNTLSPTDFRYLPKELDTLYADAAWAAVPTLQNSWVNNGGTNANAQFMKDALGWVHLRGRIKNGTTTNGTLLFTLAAGNRPPYQMFFPAISGSSASGINIDTNGLVSLELTGGTTLSLDGIRFRTY